MTEQKHLKQLVRARMQKTGESYTTARRHLIQQRQPAASRRAPFHFPGSTPGPTALRSLLAAAGMPAPHTGEPFSEAMVFGIAGGIGAGMFTFHYAKENFSSFFVAGRHLWQDHLAWARAATDRLGATAIVKESSAPKAAEKQLRELLGEGRPAMAWVTFGGRQYHLVTMHAIDDAAGTALVGDLRDEPLEVPLAELAAARAQTAKDRHRLLGVAPAGPPPALRGLVREGIEACVSSLTKARMKNFRLDAFRDWADRLHGSRGADGWERIFPPGRLLYQGLRSIAEYVEFYGTGGGLCRPLFAEFLAEAGGALGDGTLAALSERYAALGRGWSELAKAALPAEVPLFRKAWEGLAARAEANASEPGSETLSLCERTMARIEQEMAGGFPLDDAAATALRQELQRRVRALYEEEVVALDALARWR